MAGHVGRHASSLVVAALILVGCAGAPMQQQELRAPAGNEGVVIGSVSMKGGRDILGRTRWDISIVKAGQGSDLAPDYSIQANRGGDEETFVTTMPAGEYRISRLQLPFSNFSYPMDVRFQVEPGKTSYIGRLLIEFPDELISIYTRVRVSVEDARDASIAKAEARAGRMLGDVATSLMAVGSASGLFLPGKSTADPRLEQDTLSMIMIMDGAHDAACKQRKVTSREVVSAHTTGAEENWVIDRCGTLVRYRVTYSPDPKGGTMIGLQPAEVIGKK